MFFMTKSVVRRGADAIFFVAICHYGEAVKIYLLKLHFLKRRRVRENLIEVFKWVKDFFLIRGM